MSLKERDFKVTYEDDDYYVRLCIIGEEYEVVTVSDSNKDPAELDEEEREEISELAVDAAEKSGWREAEEEEKEEDEEDSEEGVTGS